MLVSRHISTINESSSKNITSPQRVSSVSSAVLTQKQDWGGLFRSWQPFRTSCLPPGFLAVPICCFCSLTFHSQTSRSFLQAMTSLLLLSTQQFFFSPRQSSRPLGSELDSSSSFNPLCPFPFCLCRRIKGKQGDKRFSDSREQREKSLCVAYKTAPFTLAVCVLGLHLPMKPNPMMSWPFWKFPSNIWLLTNMGVVSCSTDFKDSDSAPGLKAEKVKKTHFDWSVFAVLLSY